MNNFQKTNVVCFGGGTGLPSLLKGLKTIPELDITAVVNMFDTGGSSGELRDKFRIFPPGDILKCLLALAEDDASARKILLKRISKSPRTPESPERLGRTQSAGGFVGHTGGNVLLVGLEKVYGSYREAVDALGQILSVKGKVLPVTLMQGTICARYKDGFVCKGEVNVDKHLFEGREIEELFLEPHVEASSDAREAIKNADVLCVGPGSFYTSIMPNFLPKGVKESMIGSRAPIIFVCNLLTEGLGMRGYAVERVVEILERELGRSVDAVIVNTKMPEKKILDRYVEERKRPFVPNVANSGKLDKRIIPEDLWLDPGIARHDSERLAGIVFGVIKNILKEK